MTTTDASKGSVETRWIRSGDRNTRRHQVKKRASAQAIKNKKSFFPQNSQSFYWETESQRFRHNNERVNGNYWDLLPVFKGIGWESPYVCAICYVYCMYCMYIWRHQNMNGRPPVAVLSIVTFKFHSQEKIPLLSCTWIKWSPWAQKQSHKGSKGAFQLVRWYMRSLLGLRYPLHDDRILRVNDKV